MRFFLLLIPLFAFLALACGGEEQAQPTPTSSPQPTATPEAAASETLAFLRAGDVWLVDADGSHERALSLTGVESFSWVSATELDVSTDGDQPRHVLVDLDGSATELPFPAGGSWSRDSTRYVVPRDQQIVVYRRDGTEVTRLQVAPPPEEGPKARRCGDPLLSGGKPSKLVFGQPVFSPDGRSVVVAVNCNLYQGVTGSLPAPVYEVSLDGTANWPLGDLQTNLEVLAGPRFSPDGAHVAQGRFVGISACAGDYNVNVAPAAGGTMQELTLPAIRDVRGEPRAAIRGGVVGYDWSPESDTVVASVNASVCRSLAVEPYVRVDPVVAGLYILKLDGSPEEKLLDGPTRSPAWSPSGRYIAYISQEYFGQEIGPPLLRVIDVTTREVVDLGQGEQPAWRP